MQNKLWKKGIVLGIIMLFIGTSVVSAIDVFDESKPENLGNILYVGGSGSGNYSKIQDAIDDATDGDTVFVYDDSSPYNENIQVYKSISLIGENRDSTIINGENPYSVIVLSSDSITFTGFTLKNTGDASVGIFVDGASGCSIYNNKITDIFTGIRLFNKDKICSDNEITDNIILSSTAFGIELQNSNNNTISFNTVSGTTSGSGIYVEYFSSNNIIKNNNLMYNDQAGVQVTSDNNIITDNTISLSAYNGIAVYSSSQIVEKNTISNCSCGISFFKVNNCDIKENILSGNEHQIKVIYCSDITIMANKLSNNSWYGLNIESSEKIIVKENTLLNNKIYIQSSKEINILKNTISYDISSDGIIIIDTTNTNISVNSINRCENGIHFFNSSSNLVSNNNIIANNIGIFLEKSDNNIINYNNFKRDKKPASFQDCNNFWDANYWNRPRFTPYIIIGKKTVMTYIFGEIHFPLLNYDRHPAKEPYDNP
jgi:nitrous oxidase accessory protein